MSAIHPSHFFKYCTARVAKFVLGTQKMRWNSPLNYNDPFDCFFSLEPKFDFRSVTSEHRNRFFDLLSQTNEPAFDSTNPFAAQMSILRKLLKGKSRSDIEMKLGVMFDHLPGKLEETALLIRSIWKTEMEQFRLLCVCEGNDNLLLWSLYTDCHRGAVFQMECLEELDVPLLAASRVTYSDEPPGIASSDEWIESFLGLKPPLDGGSTWTKLVTTKAKAFEHEREWRCVLKRRDYENVGYEDCSFSPREISKVFLGTRISDEDKGDILKLLDGPFSHVEVFQAKQHPTKYALTFTRIR